MHLRDSLQFRDRNPFIRAAHIMRGWAIDQGGQPRHAEPTRIGTADAHIHGHGFAQHFFGHLMNMAHDR